MVPNFNVAPTDAAAPVRIHLRTAV
jgi:hypothetical protein